MSERQILSVSDIDLYLHCICSYNSIYLYHPFYIYRTGKRYIQGNRALDAPVLCARENPGTLLPPPSRSTSMASTYPHSVLCNSTEVHGNISDLHQHKGAQRLVRRVLKVELLSGNILGPLLWPHDTESLCYISFIS